jgi:hypothetical protein
MRAEAVARPALEAEAEMPAARWVPTPAPTRSVDRQEPVVSLVPAASRAVKGPEDREDRPRPAEPTAVARPDRAPEPELREPPAARAVPARCNQIVKVPCSGLTDLVPFRAVRAVDSGFCTRNWVA